jgi:hypothetical protein
MAPQKMRQERKTANAREPARSISVKLFGMKMPHEPSNAGKDGERPAMRKSRQIHVGWQETARRSAAATAASRTPKEVQRKVSAAC